MKIEITEGCVCYSYLIDGKEYVNLADSDHKDYNPSIIKKAFKLLLKDAERLSNNSIWDRLFCHFNDSLIEEVVADYINNELNKNNLSNLQGMFIDLVMYNLNTKVTSSGPCDCCGDYIYTHILELPEEG